MAEAAEYSMIGVAGRRLRVGQWHVGQMAHRPLVLLNGIGMNIELMEPLAQALPERRVICFDLPGIGKSPAPIFPYTIPCMALTTASLLDRFGIESADLLGISWGGALAQQFAFQHRARTGRIILASTSAGAIMAPGDFNTLRHLADPLEYTVERSLKRNLASLYNGGGNAIVSLNAAIAPTPLGWAYQMASFGTWTSTPFLPLLDMPVMIMGDDEDKIVPPSNFQFLHTAIPGSRLEMFSGGGHLFMMSQQDKFVAKLRSFLDEVRSED